MRQRIDGRAIARPGLAAACLLAGLALAGAATAGEIKSFDFPVPTFDEHGAEQDDVDLMAADVPNADDVVVYGYWPAKNLLLIQPDPKNPRSAVYINFDTVMMRDQDMWKAKMKDPRPLVCSHRTGVTVATTNPNLNTTGSKGFKNPC